MFGEAPLKQLYWTRRNQKLFVLLTPLLWLTVFSLFLIAAMLPLLRSFTAIFMLTALLISLTACVPWSRGLAAQDLPLPLTPILSTSLMQELTSILSLSSLSLVNSGTLSLLLYFHLPMTWTLSRGRYQDTYPFLSAIDLKLSQGPALQWAFLLYFCCPTLPPFYIKKKKNRVSSPTQCFAQICAVP